MPCRRRFQSPSKCAAGSTIRPKAATSFFEIFDGAYELGVAAITVHGRTVLQRYDGPSRWEFFRELKAARGFARRARKRRFVFRAGMPRHARTTPASTASPWPAGRSAIHGSLRHVRALAAGEPLPDPPTLHEQREVISEHYRLAEELYGAERCLPDMRKFAIKYSQLHPCHEQVRAEFCGVKLPGAWRDVLAKWYAADGPGVHPVVIEPNP